MCWEFTNFFSQNWIFRAGLGHFFLWFWLTHFTQIELSWENNRSLHCKYLRCYNFMEPHLNWMLIKLEQFRLQFVIKLPCIPTKLLLKSVSSNLTLAVRSPKFWHAKTNFLSHYHVCYINRFANFLTRTNGVMISIIDFWSTDCVFESRPSQYLLLFFFLKWDKKWVLAWQNFGERTARVKLEITDFNT